MARPGLVWALPSHRIYQERMNRALHFLLKNRSNEAWNELAASCRAARRAFTSQAPSVSAVGSCPARPARPPPTLGRRARQLMREYRQLAKGNLTALVVSTAAAGFAAGSPSAIDWAGMGWLSAGTALCSASAAALNQIYEVETDRLMRRTATRPLPSGRMGRGHALAFAIVTGLSGVGLLAQKTNALTAGLGAANIALYAGVYTPLKTVLVANTWVGAIVGAVPPLMGWAAATGGLDMGAAVLGLGLYFWQLPHFMALAWIARWVRFLCSAYMKGSGVLGWTGCIGVSRIL